MFWPVSTSLLFVCLFITGATAEILDLCDKRRQLRTKRFEAEGSEKYKEGNNDIKRCMKKTKENWIGEQCSEIEENLRTNNSKRAYQVVKDLTTVKQWKLILSMIIQKNASQRNNRCWTDGQNTALSCTITRHMASHQNWAVSRYTQRTTNPSFAKKWNRIIEETEVSWSRQHPSRTGPSRWRKCTHCSHNNLPQDLADRRITNRVDPVLSQHSSEESQPAAVPELPNIQPHQPPKQSCWRSCWTNWSHRRRRSSLKTRQASEQERAQLSRSWTYESCVRNISSTNKTMSS